MTTLCEAFPTVSDARRAVGALQAQTAARSLGLLTASRYHDVRSERVGGFGGPVYPEAPFGKWAGPERRRWQAAGGFAGHPDAQRQGSFADIDGDIDGDLGITYEHGSEIDHIDRVVSAKRLLTGAGASEETAERMLDEIRHGHTVLFAELATPDAEVRAGGQDPD